MTTTPRLGITQLEEDQALPEVVVNEADAILELFGNRLAVLSQGDNAPAGGEADGEAYLVGPAGTGAFLGEDNKLALRINGGWIFRAPKEGMEIEVEDEAASLVYRGGSWVSSGGAIEVLDEGVSETTGLVSLNFTGAGVTATDDGSGNVEVNIAGGGGGGGVTGESLPCGRLTLTSTVPVMNADATAQSTIYYAPYRGSNVPIFDGADWNLHAFTQLTLSLDATNHVSGSLYDIFIWNDAGTIKIGTGPAWSSTTSRGTGAGTTELELKDGVWTNKVSITLKNGAGAGTAGIAANTATYVGSFYATANGQTAMSFKPTQAAGGTNNILGLYNAYNRVRTFAMSRDSTHSTYNSTTWRAANGSNSNRVTFVDGLQESMIDAAYQSGGNGAGTSGFTGVCLDSTSNAPEVGSQMQTPATTTLVMSTVRDKFQPQLGLHYVQAMEASSGSFTFYGNLSTPTRRLNGLTVELEM